MFIKQEKWLSDFKNSLMKYLTNFFLQRKLNQLILLASLLFSFYSSGQEENKAVLIEEFIYVEAPFPSCHASTLAETPEGVVAAWFGGTHEQHKDVEIWFSRNTNGKWSAPVSIANGIDENSERYPTWNPVLFQIPNGKLLLYYKVGPNPQSWWGMVKFSEDNGLTWSDGKKLSDGILGPIKNKPVLLENGTIISPSSTEHEGWKVHFELSADSGETWEIVGPINSSEEFSIIQPSVLTYGHGKLQALCRSKENRIVTIWSDDYGKTWSTPEATELPNPNSGTDAETLNNGLQLLVYNHSERREEEWGGPRTPLNVAVSKDGTNWKQVLVLEDQPGEYSYPAVIQTTDGLIHITYTWNREKIKYVVINSGNLL
jgi:predicted neuraminidase